MQNTVTKHAVVIRGGAADGFEQAIFISDDGTFSFGSRKAKELLCSAAPLRETKAQHRTAGNIAAAGLGFLAGSAATVFVWLLCVML